MADEGNARTRIRLTEDAVLRDHNHNVIVKQEAAEKDDPPCASSLSHASSDDIYDVEKILDRRFNEEKKCYEYSLKWVGYRRPTWEEEKNILSKALLKEFKQSLKEKRTSAEMRRRSLSGSGSPSDSKTRSSSQSLADVLRGSLPIKRGPGRPPKNSTTNSRNSLPSTHERVSAKSLIIKKEGKRGPGRPPKARPISSVPIKPLSAEKKPAATSTPRKPPPVVQSIPSMSSASQLKLSVKTKADGFVRPEKVTFKGTVVTFDEGAVDELEALALEDGEQNGFEKGLKIVRVWRAVEHNDKLSCIVRFVGLPMPQLIPAEEVDKHAPLELMWYMRLKTQGIIG